MFVPTRWKRSALHLVRLFAVVAAGWGATFAVATFGPLQESIRSSLGLTDNEVSVLQGPIFYLPSIFAAIPLGYLIDRLSRAMLLSVFVAADGAAIVLVGLSGNFFELAIARALIGALMSAIAMDVSALLGSMVSAARRGKALMILSFAQIVGMSAAFYLGGWAATREGTTWSMAMRWLSAPLAITFLLTLLVREPPRDRVTRKSRISIGEAWQRVWAMRGRVLPLAFGPVGLSVGYMASLVWAPPILTRTLGLRADQVGAVMGTSLFVSACLGPLLGGFTADRIERVFGPRAIVVALAVLAGLEIPAGLFGLMPDAPRFEVLLTVLSTVFFMKSVLVTALSIAVFPNEIRGLCFGIQNAVMGIFASISPIVVSQLAAESTRSNRIGFALSAVCVTTSVAGLISFVFSRRHFPENQREAGVSE